MKSNDNVMPEVGMGVTEYLYSDRKSYTIIEISKSKRICKIQEDRSIRTDSNGMSTLQKYRYEPNPDGGVISISLRKDGNWRKVRYDKSSTFAIGFRSAYHDFSF